MGGKPKRKKEKKHKTTILLLIQSEYRNGQRWWYADACYVIVNKMHSRKKIVRRSNPNNISF